MARNKVMKLWTAVVTAFLTLCTTLGLITTTASAAVPPTEPTRNSDSAPSEAAPATKPAPLLSSLIRALPPTMKQRIHAEAHGASPSCRHRVLPDTATTDCSVESSSSPEPVPGTVPIQR
ncbi:DUF6344 domain-containing protein [Streptomyces sp. G35A]|jgi:hypothetical protein